MSGTGKTNIINAMTNLPFDTNKISALTSTFIQKVIEIKKIYHRIMGHSLSRKI